MRMVRSCRRRVADWGGEEALDRVCCQLLQLILGLREMAKATDMGTHILSESLPLRQEQQPSLAGHRLFSELSGQRFCAF